MVILVPFAVSVALPLVPGVVGVGDEEGGVWLLLLLLALLGLWWWLSI